MILLLSSATSSTEALVGTLCRKGVQSRAFTRYARSSFVPSPPSLSTGTNVNSLNRFNYLPYGSSQRKLATRCFGGLGGHYLSKVDKHFGVSSQKEVISTNYSTRTGINAQGEADEIETYKGQQQIPEEKKPLSLSSALSIEEYKLPEPINDVLSIEDLRKGQRIVSFGDVHGDIDALVNFLVTAKIMDKDSTACNPIWCGGDTICVQTGDILDRGDDELACLRLLASLSRQAAEKGGSLTILYGNHEAINCIGLFQYANPGGNVEFEVDIGKPIDDRMGSNRWRLQFAGNQPSRWAAMEPGGLLASAMLANMKVAVVVGRTVFVHAGLTSGHIRKYGGVVGMNREVKEWITKAHHGDNNDEGNYETVDDVLRAAQIRSKAASVTMPECLGGGSDAGASSPVWMRDYSNPNDGEPKGPYVQTMIDEALKELGGDVQRMVMGHTPQFRINAALKGKAWRVDVGASKGVMSGTPEVLEIIHGGEDEDDVVKILTMSGEAICSSERQVMSVANLL